MQANVKLGKSLEIERADKTAEVKKKRSLNVLLLGHADSGKTTAIRKVLDLEIRRLKNKRSRNLGQTVDKNEDKHVEGENLKFGTVRFETETSRYHFLEAPSTRQYESKLTSKAMQADIAVLFVSGSEVDVDESLKAQQSQECVYMIRRLCIKNILLVVNKIDDPTWKETSYDEIKSNTFSFLKQIGFKNDFECIPVSFESGLNIQSKMGKETCTWWDGPCFFDTLDSFKVQAHGSSTFTQGSSNEESNLMKDLVTIDLLLDEDSSNALSWYNRALLLENAINPISSYCSELFEATAKAAEYGFPIPQGEDTALYSLIQGHQYRAKKDFETAIKHFIMASSFFLKKENTKAMQHSILILREIEKEWDDSKEKCSVALGRMVVGKVDDDKKKDIARVVAEEKKAPRKQNENRAQNRKSGRAQNRAQKTIVQDKVSATSHKEVKGDDEVKPKEYDDERTNIASCVTQDTTQEFRVIKMSGFSRYEIIICEEGRPIYDGTKIMNDIKLPQSFVACSQSQMKNYEALLSLGLNDTRILSVGDILKPAIGGEFSTFFAVKSVKTIDIFFSKLESQWHGVVQARDVGTWWGFFEQKFKKIYRDVVDGLLFLYSKNYCCGDLFGATHNSIYITNDEQVRILPSMKSEITCSLDVKDLLKNMRGIINLPFSGERLLLNELPIDLSHLLTFINPNKLLHVPATWLLDHFSLWTPQERVEFIFSVKDLLKKGRIHDFSRVFHNTLTNAGMAPWSAQIPEGIFLQIYKKGDPNRPKVTTAIDDLGRMGWVQVPPYLSSSHLVRYMVAAYTHYNDPEYSGYRRDVLDAVDIERELSLIFPKIYEHLFNTLYICAANGDFEELDKDLMKLSRHRDK